MFNWCFFLISSIFLFESSDIVSSFPKTSSDKMLKFSSSSKKLKKLHVGGGEPLIHKRTFWLLNELVNLGVSNNIEVVFYTNLTVLPEKILDIARFFKDMCFSVSLDGLGKVNEYIRYPSKFIEIQDNLDRLNLRSKSVENIHIEFHTVFQIYNIFNILLVLGITASIFTIPVAGVVNFDMIYLILISILLFLIADVILGKFLGNFL